MKRLKDDLFVDGVEECFTMNQKRFRIESKNFGGIVRQPAMILYVRCGSKLSLILPPTAVVFCMCKILPILIHGLIKPHFIFFRDATRCAITWIGIKGTN